MSIGPNCPSCGVRLPTIEERFPKDPTDPRKVDKARAVPDHFTWKRMIYQGKDGEAAYCSKTGEMVGFAPYPED